MKYSYHVPASSYTRASQYTPTQYGTTSHYTPSTKYTPTKYSSTYSSAAKYTPTSYTPSYHTPSSSLSSLSSSSSYTSPYKSTSSSTYVPSYSKGSQYSSTRTAWTPVIAPTTVPYEPPEPPKRAVHFPNEIIFQDLVRRGDMEQIGRFMRARKVRVDAVFPSGLSAIHEAVLTGNLDVVKLLIRYGADFHQTDEDGWTPLHMACSDGYPDIAKYLIRQGASTDAETEGGEKPGDLIDPECKDLAKLFEIICA